MHGGLRRRPEQRRLHRALVSGMSRTTQVTCVCCPRGCSVRVDEAQQVSGNGCRNGAAYALQQLRDPLRRVTGEVRIVGAAVDRCPVKTDRPVPVDQLDQVAEALKALEVTAPVTVSQVLVRDFCGTGANLVACASISKQA